mmetsp:Transcript_12999/g.45701  ORF Transcript_12999/g.45701 Transcript_12999/m.45701 type:complete len:234 (+) Transcript_12999:968-1669(+)
MASLLRSSRSFCSFSFSMSFISCCHSSYLQKHALHHPHGSFQIARKVLLSLLISNPSFLFLHRSFLLLPLFDLSSKFFPRPLLLILDFLFHFLLLLVMLHIIVQSHHAPLINLLPSLRWRRLRAGSRRRLRPVAVDLIYFSTSGIRVLLSMIRDGRCFWNSIHRREFSLEILELFVCQPTMREDFLHFLHGFQVDRVVTCLLVLSVIVLEQIVHQHFLQLGELARICCSYRRM